ncbi:MAG TPA: FtsX-like permease family protein, partial [Bryobacteraceae bacterium]|nr:FtsX-like permease family protein [Bryobacteraceae bacterium]
PGITIAAARAEAESIFRAALDEEFHGRQDSSYWVTGEFRLQPIGNGVSLLRPKFSSALLLLMSGGALLLLIVCANVGGLLLARTASRRGEIAIRLAVGATGKHLVRQWLTEILVLTSAGGLVGVCTAWVATPFLVRVLPQLRELDATLLTLSLDLKPDTRLLAFSFLLCGACALLAGLPAAVQASRQDLHTALKATRATSRQPLRWILVAFQVALCTLLLSVAGLLFSTFNQLQALDPGFDRDHVVTFTVDPGMLSYTPQQCRTFRSRLQEAVQELPGVASVAVASRGLMRGTGLKTTYAPAGQTSAPADFMNTSLNWVSPEYFDTMGIRLLAGRNFRPDEVPAKPRQAVVNQAFVRRFFPRGEAIGQTFGQGFENQVANGSYQIIGIVSDAKYRSLREAIQPTVYQSWALGDVGLFILHVRTHNDPKAIIDPVRHVLHSMDPRLPFDEIHTLAEEVDASLWPERTLAWLSAAFSVIAAALAALGVFGALSYAIAQMKREIGIRVALGAPPTDVLRMLSAKPMMFAGLGVAAGVVAFIFSAPAFGGVVYGVSVNDPFAVTCAATAVLLLVLCATLSAAREALRVNPASLLREE